MLDNESPNLGNPETEVPKIREVRLNHPFPLFRAADLENLRETPLGGRYASEIILSTDILPNMSFNVNASSSNIDRGNTLTPANPELGYIITREDFDRVTRRRKVENSYNDLNQNIDGSQRLGLSVECDRWNLEKAGIKLPNITTYDTSPIKPEYDEILRQLQLSLTFVRGGKYLSAEPPPLLQNLKYGIRFYSFYPLETGPLAASYNKPEDSFATVKMINLGKGLHIHLPNDPEYLSKIYGTFILNAPHSDNEDEY